MAQQVFSVTQINTYLQQKLDSDALLASVAVSGEISNYKLYPSGHHYFTLKDDGGALKCVMFKGNAFRLRFRPENGMKVIVMGKISVYPRDGAYQLYCTTMAMDGIGDLYAAFEQLKKKLSAEGLFDPSHKKSLPAYPGVIGIVTSAAGAAVHDMLRILKKRYPLSKVRLLPVRVQGAEAPGEIAAAIAYANRHRLADLLIVGRGGGSMEDLWAFNDERVAYAIYQSVIPIISAVGHEPDVTISDYVADMRAATPSNAAELAVPDQDALRQSLDSISVTMLTAFSQQLKSARQGYKILSASPVLSGPDAYLKQLTDKLEFAKNRLITAQNRLLSKEKQAFIANTAKLDAMSPLKVLTRGYSITQNADGDLLRSVNQIQAGEQVTVTVSDGSFKAAVCEIMEEHQ